MIVLVGVSKPITFSRELKDFKTDLIVPKDFVKDFHFSSEEHLMVMLRVVGPDTSKVVDFFEDGEGELFDLKTIEDGTGKEISDEFLLVYMYIDEGPPLSVDIDVENPIVRVILDFQRKNV